MERLTFFDVDKTTFDTKSSGEKTSESLALATGRSVSEINEINKEYKEGLASTTDFNHNDFLRKVASETGVVFKTLKQAMLKPENFVLYPETLFVLRELWIRGEKSGLFTEADPEWQNEKIKLTGIIDFLDPSLILIERRKLKSEAIAKIPNGATLIDDKKEVIETLKQLRPDLKLVWINRKSEEEMEGVRTIHNLNELL